MAQTNALGGLLLNDISDVATTIELASGGGNGLPASDFRMTLTNLVASANTQGYLPKKEVIHVDTRTGDVLSGVTRGYEVLIGGGAAQTWSAGDYCYQFITMGMINEKLTSGDLGSYVTHSELSTALSAYITSVEVSALLSDYATTSDLSGYSTTSHNHDSVYSKFGIGQSFNDVTGSRSSGVAYTNSTSNLMWVLISFGDTGGLAHANIVVDGVTLFDEDYDIGAGSATAFPSFPVPAGKSYTVTASGAGIISRWIEFS